MSPRKIASSCSWFARKSRTAVRGPSSRAASSWRLVRVRLLGEATKRRARDTGAPGRHGRVRLRVDGAPCFTPGRDVSCVQMDAVGPECLERRLLDPAEIVAGLKEFDVGAPSGTCARTWRSCSWSKRSCSNQRTTRFAALEQLVSTRKLRPRSRTLHPSPARRGTVSARAAIRRARTRAGLRAGVVPRERRPPRSRSPAACSRPTRRS